MNAEEPTQKWLSPDEEAAWRAYLVSNQMLMRALERQLRHDSGLAHTDYALLVQLSSRAGGTARVTELAGFLDHSQSRTSHAISRLERAGLVRREHDSEDGRVVHVGLTGAGRAKLEAAAPGHVRVVRELVFDGLDADQLAAFRATCESMMSRMLDTPPCGPPM